MTLTLFIRNVDRLDNGAPTEFVLHRRGGTIGRSPTCDWSLPDPRNYISSKHCEISFAGNSYMLSDISTNGTFLNGSGERMSGPRQIEGGDVFQIGHYEVTATLSGSAAYSAASGAEPQPAQPAWTGWDSQVSESVAAAPADPGGWDSPPVSGGGAVMPAAPAAPAAASAGSWAPPVAPSLARPEAHRSDGFAAPPSPQSAAGGWAPSHSVPQMPASSTWEAAMPPPEQASAWSSAAPDRPPAPSADDVWGKIAEGNVVDWARGGFGRPEEVNNNPLGLNKAEPSAALPKAQAQLAQNLGWDAPAAQPTTPPPAPAASAPAAAASIAPPPVAPAPAAASPSAATPAATNDQLLAVLVEAAGLAPRDVTIAAPDAMKRAGMLLRRLIAGLVVMVEARARAKSQMGAEATSFEFDGNNPLKFARTPEQAIAQLLNPPQRGFMDTDRAIEDAFYDLQSHQMATLKAMQGALRATLARFSPTAIKQRAENKGVLARILPQARDAELWQNYEREFSGVAQGSDEAFMDVFAKEFRKAYEEQARQQRKR